MKVKPIKYLYKSLKVRKENKNIFNEKWNNRNKNKTYNLFNLIVNNRYEDKNKNIQKEKKEFFDVQNNKMRNISDKYLEIKNKKSKEQDLQKPKPLNIFIPNSFNEDNYLTKRNNDNNNFSNIKVKKMKHNLNSIIFNYNKENQIFQYRLNNCKKKVNEYKRNIKGNNSYITNKELIIEDNKNKNRKKKENIYNTKKKLIKDIYGINKEYFKLFINNKYSASFVKEPFKIKQKYNIISNEKIRNDISYNKKKEKERNKTKSFEDKKITKQKITTNKNFKENFNYNIHKKKNSTSLISKKLKKENRYQNTEYSSSFNKTLPINKKKENINSFERINSHKILITNININLYKENENNNLMNIDDVNDLNIRKEKYSEENILQLEKAYLLREKIYKILKKINEYISCDEECLNLIEFYFGINFYKKELNIFKKINNYKKIFNYTKLELLCYFLCYDISLNQNFSKASILLKSIINILYQNYLILLSYFLHLYNINNNSNDLWADKIDKIIKKELKINLNFQDMNEDSITSLIFNTFQNISNYYEMIIDNLYSFENKENDDEYIFPNCLKMKENQIDKEKKEKIICLFFKQANKSLNIYTYENMKLFFYLYLNNQKNSFITNNYEIKKEEKTIQYYLAPIKSRYKYTLIINLDETLIYNDNNKIILRPNLFDFLSKVKEMFEIIIFSFYPNSIIDKAIELIENKNKYFDYVLYSEQLIINYKGKLLKDLENFGRDIKHIIIIDSKVNIQKKYKNNLILIKGFFGDITKDINLLKILGYILQNIKNDNYEDDLRVRIKRYKKSIKTYLH